MSSASGCETDPPAEAAVREPPPDHSEFSALMRSEFERVWRLLRRLGVTEADADDATQQVFLVMARKWGSLVTQQPRRFLYAATLRVAANARRSVRRRREVSEDGVLEVCASGPDQHARVEQRRAIAFVDEILEQFPDELRRVFVLAEIEQLTAAVIAELESVPPGTIASRLRRARVMFRELVERERHRHPFEEHHE